MKKKRKMLLLLPMCCLFLAGCSKKISIVYHSTGGSNFQTVTKEQSELSTYELPTPTKEGYTFEGWYFDSELTNKYDVNKLQAGGVLLNYMQNII